MTASTSHHRRFAASLAAGALLAAAASHAAPPLAAHGADVSAITVSGLSAGGQMAVQFHVAHSATVTGAGVMAGSPWYCAGGSAWTAMFHCMKPRAFAPLPPLARLHAAVAPLERGGRIDPTRHLSAARVWIFSGTRDDTVVPAAAAALASWYGQYVKTGAVKFVRDLPAGHAVVSPDPDVGERCEASRPPYLNRCVDPATGAPYDAAGELLAHLLTARPAAPPQEAGTIVEFDQREFVTRGPYSISLADTGYAYVPPACRERRCRVHVALHGCGQQAGPVERPFVRDAGYNRWADAHGLIVLYPQVVARYGWAFDGSFMVNPNACWDWWGYTGPDYHTRGAPQMMAVMKMVARLGEPR